MKTISVKIIPRAKKIEVIELTPNSFKIRLTAAPVDGKANDQLLKILAKHFKIAKSCLVITKGLTSRNKIVNIQC